EPAASELVCAACGAPQPAPPGEDLFAALGLPRRFAVEPAELERRWKEGVRAVHPDRFARAAPRARSVASARSALLHQAYRTLREPRARAAYLLSLLGAGPGVASPALLEEQLVLRERLASAHAAGEGEAVRIAGALAVRLAGIDARLAELLAPEEPGSEAVMTVAQLLAEARLLDRALEAASRTQ
ncbi:MAG TPA: Fe-S protein assembly co-chaperone HscB, partial [Anaeromyxobacteraceae bacterium]